MIYDCFLYNNEAELLEIRVEELKNCSQQVTHVLIDSNVTHTGEKKGEPRYYADSSIIFFTVTDMPIGSGARDMEVYQRNYILKALSVLNPSEEDTIIVSDVDEIPRAKSVNTFIKSNIEFAALIQNKYAYYLNWLESENSWDRIRIMRYGYLKDKTPEEVRNSGYEVSINNAGWHFSWLHHMAKEKLSTFSHQELNNEENFKLIEEQKTFWTEDEVKRVEVDLSYPRWLFENQEKFKHIIDQ